MYHIKEDKRAKKSAMLVVKALDSYLETHDFEGLTITEICNQSTVSRATFYRLFDDLQDIVAYKCELLAQEFTEEFLDLGMEELQLSFFRKWMQNIEFLKLIVSLKRIDIIFDCHRTHIDSICHGFKNEEVNDLDDYCTVMLTQILVGTLLMWCEHGCKESAEELVAHTKRAIYNVGLMFG